MTSEDDDVVGAILGKYLGGMEPVFRRTWRGTIRPGHWANPATGETAPMTRAEFESLRQTADNCLCGHPADGHGYERPCMVRGCNCAHFWSRSEVEAEVNAGLSAKQERMDRINAVLDRPDLDPADPRVKQLGEERQHLRTFFWLVRGGDRSGEPFPNPSQDMSIEELDLLAKYSALEASRE